MGMNYSYSKELKVLLKFDARMRLRLIFCELEKILFKQKVKIWFLKNQDHKHHGSNYCIPIKNKMKIFLIFSQ